VISLVLLTDFNIFPTLLTEFMNLWPSNSPDLNPVDYYPRIARYMLQQRGWLAGWLSVTAGIVYKQLKLILKLFQPSDSLII